MNGSLRYLDTSALVKLVRTGEIWGADLLRHLRASHEVIISSALARTELLRATFGDSAETAVAEKVIEDVELVAITTSILDRAGRLAPAQERSLDAIHLATALSLSADVSELITYHDRMIGSGRTLGLPVQAPGRRV
ncbi:MAG: type II toxin-antitoxin system VapC family toxin [Candidatus Dormiibacterota bacterium]